jgi:hypothetical protein
VIKGDDGLQVLPGQDNLVGQAADEKKTNGVDVEEDSASVPKVIDNLNVLQEEMKSPTEKSPKRQDKRNEHVEKMRQRMKDAEQRQGRGLQSHKTSRKELAVPSHPLRPQSSQDTLLTEQCLQEDEENPRPSLQLMSSPEVLDQNTEKGRQRSWSRPRLRLRKSLEFLDKLAGKVKQSELSLPTLRIRRSEDTLRPQTKIREADRRPSLQITSSREPLGKPKDRHPDRPRPILRIRPSQESVRKQERIGENSAPSRPTIRTQIIQVDDQFSRGQQLSPIDSPTLIEQKTFSAIQDSLQKAYSTKRLNPDKQLLHQRSNSSFHQERKRPVRKTHSSEDMSTRGRVNEWQIVSRQNRSDSTKNDADVKEPTPQRSDASITNEGAQRSRVKQRRRTNSQEKSQRIESRQVGEEALPHRPDQISNHHIIAHVKPPPKRLACPFYQHAPEQHQRNGCADQGWDFLRLK